MPPIDALLAPVDAEHPSGDDLSFSADFDAIVEARRHDDPSLDQGEWVVPLKEADWKQVIERSTALLTTRTKDLRLAVWLAEADTKVRGMQGLTDGFRLIAAFCDAYWDTMHPVPDDGDPERRIGNLAWFLARAGQLLAEVPLTEGRGTAYPLCAFEAARAREGSGESPPQGAVPLAVMEAARRKSSQDFYRSLLCQAGECRQALLELEQAVDRRLGVDGPSFTATRDMLDRVTDAIHKFAEASGVRLDSTGAADDRPGAAASTASTAPAIDSSALSESRTSFAHAGGLQSRSEALKMLREVAAYFRRTEPHSPVAYLADKAADWGDMPLHQWLQAVITDGASLSHVEALLGIAPNPSRE